MPVADTAQDGNPTQPASAARTAGARRGQIPPDVELGEHDEPPERVPDARQAPLGAGGATRPRSIGGADLPRDLRRDRRAELHTDRSETVPDVIRQSQVVRPQDAIGGKPEFRSQSPPPGAVGIVAHGPKPDSPHPNMRRDGKRAVREEPQARPQPAVPIANAREREIP